MNDIRKNTEMFIYFFPRCKPHNFTQNVISCFDFYFNVSLVLVHIIVLECKIYSQSFYIFLHIFTKDLNGWSLPFLGVFSLTFFLLKRRFHYIRLGKCLEWVCRERVEYFTSSQILFWGWVFFVETNKMEPSLWLRTIHKIFLREDSVKNCLRNVLVEIEGRHYRILQLFVQNWFKIHVGPFKYSLAVVVGDWWTRFYSGNYSGYHVQPFILTIR